MFLSESDITDLICSICVTTVGEAVLVFYLTCYQLDFILAS